MIKFDDFREQQTKVSAFLSSEYSEYCETSSNRRSCELSCVKEEDHVELNDPNNKDPNQIFDLNEESQSSFKNSNNTSKNYVSGLPSIYFKRQEKSEHDSTLTNETSLNAGAGNNTLDNIFGKCSKNQNDCLGNFSMNGINQQALFSQQQLGISIGEFRSGEMLAEELAKDQQLLQTTTIG